MHSYASYTMLILVVFLCIILCAIIGSYIFLFYFKRTIEEYNIFFNDYNYNTKMCIAKYGDFKISNAYIILTPIKPFEIFVSSIISFQNCKLITNRVKHVKLMIEINMNDNNTKKFIVIDKTTYINILTDFQIDDTCEIYNIKITHENTLRGLLNETRKRIGTSKFFNWHFYKNNCQDFIRHLALILNDEFTYSQYKFKSRKKSRKYFNKMFYSNYSINAYYSMLFIYNFFQKYMNNVQQHVISKLISANI